MSIPVNEGGTIKELTNVYVNESGTVKDLSKVYANESGALKEIYTKETDLMSAVGYSGDYAETHTSSNNYVTVLTIPSSIDLSQYTTLIIECNIVSINPLNAGSVFLQVTSNGSSIGSSRLHLNGDEISSDVHTFDVDLSEYADTTVVIEVYSTLSSASQYVELQFTKIILR